MAPVIRCSPVVAALASVLFLACGGSRTSDRQAPPPDVCVAGYLFNGTANVAMTWTNGRPVALTDGTRDAKALAIVVSGGEVFVAGGQSNASGVGVATLWRNGTAIPLSDGSHQAMAECVAVSGGDVYAAGYESSDGGGDLVTYWKNGVPVRLSDGTTTGEATAMAVVGSDVFVAGWTYETTEVSPQHFVISPVAKLWKNGVLTRLSDPATEIGIARSLAVVDGDVYVAGYTAPSGVGSAPYLARYWKNGLAVPLTDGTHGAKAFAVAAAGGSVYAAGFTSAGGGVMATMWKDGHAYPYTTGGSDALILAMAIGGLPTQSTVYSAGWEGSVAKVWVNGVPQPLTDGSQEAEALGLCLVAK